MIFNEETTRQLKAKLNGTHVRTREWQGKTLSYIEGWHAISEANRIFGFDAWDRHTAMLKCVCEHQGKERASASYLAKVRITVRAGPHKVIREGTGAGYASGVTIAEVHALAAKEAETDATKRALSTFGNPFGLALYDKTQKGVRKPRQAKSPTPKPRLWVIRDPGGAVRGQFTDAEACARSLQQTIEQIATANDLARFWQANAVLAGELDTHLDKQVRRGKPNGNGHNQCINGPGLTGAYEARYTQLWAKQTLRPRDDDVSLGTTSAVSTKHGDASAHDRDADTADVSPAADKTFLDSANSPATIDKSRLAPPAPKRIRAPEHLKWVASLGCAVCNRQPADAHHLKRVQPNALAKKPGDQWAVPLCRLHHRALHDAGDETYWWRKNKIDAVSLAEKLWAEGSEQHGKQVNEPGSAIRDADDM